MLQLPGETPVIEIALDLVARIRAHVLRTYNDSGVETGGILFGRKSSSGTKVAIHTYEPVGSEYHHDHLYVYSDVDKSRLAPLVAARRPDLDLTPVGFFRSNARGALALTDDDVNLMRDHFSEPGDVWLLVDLAGRHMFRAGIYVRGENGIDPHDTLFEFPFDSLELQHRCAKTESTWRGFPDRSEAEKRSAPSRIPVLAAIALAAAGALGVVIVQMRKPAGAVEGAMIPGHPASALDLGMERVGSQWRLKWNGSAMAINDRCRGHLSVLDGVSRKELTLSPAELRSGRIVYIPSTDSVSFQLEVSDPERGKTASEAIRVVAGASPLGPDFGLSPTLSLSQPEYRPAPERQFWNSRRNAAQRAAIPAGGDTDSAAATSEGEHADRVAVQTPTPRDREPLIVSRSTDIDLAPPPPLSPNPEVGSMSKAVPSPTSQVPSPPERTNRVVEAMREPPAVEPQINKNPEAVALTGEPLEAPLRRRTQVSEAVLLHRVTPIYPAMAKAGRVSGVVHVMGTIGKDGRMESVEATKGPAILRGAAVFAVKQWRYSPRSVNGSPVPTPVDIDVAFNLDK